MLKLQKLESMGLPKRALRGLLNSRRKLEAFADAWVTMRLRTGGPSLLCSFGTWPLLLRIETRIGADLPPLLLFTDRSPTTLGVQAALAPCFTFPADVQEATNRD